MFLVSSTFRPQKVKERELTREVRHTKVRETRVAGSLESYVQMHWKEENIIFLSLVVGKGMRVRGYKVSWELNESSGGPMSRTFYAKIWKYFGGIKVHESKVQIHCSVATN